MKFIYQVSVKMMPITSVSVLGSQKVYFVGSGRDPQISKS